MKSRTCSVIALAPVIGATCTFLAQAGEWTDQARPEIVAAHDRCLETVLAVRRLPHAMLVAPADKRYADSVAKIRRALMRAGAMPFQVTRGRRDAERILRNRNVIALGNMSTNPFIERLYCEWRCLLDLRYPGPGGYVLRSLHDPYGTGHNVILIGGSDDAGVAKAAEVFCRLLRRANPLKVGRLMEIVLGEGWDPPDLGEDWQNLQHIRNWERGWGWNPISTAGALYYLTGDRRYARIFKALAKPDPANTPKVLFNTRQFDDPKRPIETGLEYDDHLLSCVWDLIEESPEFDDAFRLYFTKRLIEHQFWRRLYGPPQDDNFVCHTPTRHTAYKLLGIYTDSRYLQKHYPDPRWATRLASVRKSFQTFIDHPKWWDGLSSVPTYLQYVFEYFTLAGHDEFVASGAARMYMNHLLMLRTGEEKDDYNKNLAPVLLNMAGYMLQDPRFAWLARERGPIEAKFRIGRSFWPSPEQAPVPPTDLANRIMVFPPQQIGDTEIPYAEPPGSSYKLLTFRSGLTGTDDFFQLDGYFGGGRTAYHVNTLRKLRMFGGAQLLAGYNNDVDIWFEGASSLKVARSASLHTALAAPGAAYVKTEIPDLCHARWQRHMAYTAEKGCAFIDIVSARTNGPYTVRCSWTFHRDAKTESPQPNTVRIDGKAVLQCGDKLAFRTGAGSANETRDIVLQAEQSTSIGNHIGPASHNTGFLWKIDRQAYVKKGPESVFFAAGDLRSAALTLKGDFVYLDAGMLILGQATTLRLGATPILDSDSPVSVIWSLREGRLTVQAVRHAGIKFAALPEFVVEGEQTFRTAAPTPAVQAAVDAALRDAAARAPAAPAFPAREETEVKADWTPTWTTRLEGCVTHLDISHGGAIWAACAAGDGTQLYGVEKAGKITAAIHNDEQVLSLWAAKSAQQAASFAVLAGSRDDDMVRAYGKDGKQLWHFKTEVDPSYRVGTKYKGPWFSDPGDFGSKYRNRGVWSMLVGDFWGTGTEEIAIGRPVTLEFHELGGKLIKRLPTRWATNTELAWLSKRGKAKDPRLVLAGKFDGGDPNVTAIAARHRNRSDDWYACGRLVEGATRMKAWGQFGHGHLEVADLDGDGIEEVIATYTGHWNELRVWDGGTTKPRTQHTPLWMKYFGPGRGGWNNLNRMNDTFVKALEITDLDGDGKQEVIVGLKNGWLHVYDHAGNRRWGRNLRKGVRSLQAVPGGLTVGLADGRLLKLSPGGKTVRTADLGSSVEQLALVNGNGLVAGTVDGTLAGLVVR